MYSNKILALVSFTKQNIIKAPPRVVYDIISHTESYHQFIPWCDSSQIIEKKSKWENKTSLVISFGNRFKGIQYVSDVKLVHDGNVGRVHSVCKTSPLKYLDSLWVVEPGLTVNSSNVSYRLSFQFDSIALQLASSLVIKYMGQQMWNIFEKQSLKFHQENKVSQTNNRTKDSVVQVNTKSQIHFLEQFMQKHHRYQELYKTHDQFRQFVNNCHQRLKHQKDYETKMEFQIDNFLVYY